MIDLANRMLLNASILVALCVGASLACAKEDSTHEIESFVEGSYTLLGKAIASRKTYLGEVTIRKKADSLEVIRRIEGKEVKGTASVAHVTVDKIPVLRIRFVEEEKQIEETCLIKGDLDNYARLTCYLYFPEVKTEDPGMEAMFINHGRS